jgi:hypothetical protein
MYLTNNQNIILPFYPCTYLYTRPYLSTHLSYYQSEYYLSTNTYSFYRSTDRSIYLSVHLSIYLLTYLPTSVFFEIVHSRVINWTRVQASTATLRKGIYKTEGFKITLLASTLLLYGRFELLFSLEF